MLAKPTVAEAVRMCRAVFFPQQRQNDAAPAQFLFHPWPIGNWPRRTRDRRRRRKQQLLQRSIVQIIGQWPAKPRDAGALEVAVLGAITERLRPRNGALT